MHTPFMIMPDTSSDKASVNKHEHTKQNFLGHATLVFQ